MHRAGLAACLLWLTCAACSLRSLDYLHKGSDSASAGAGPNADAGAAGSADAGTCSDNTINGDETDIDCGGRRCAPCAASYACVTGTDCESAICTNQACQPALCTDLALNGDETDLNCGGSCQACADDRRCRVDQDCKSEQCSSGICTEPSCSLDVLTKGCPLLRSNVPYALMPGHAPTSCLDDYLNAVDSGAGVRQWFFHQDINQTFWAIEQPDGSFALRNALSGKCLQVRGASKLAGALVEQSACTYAANQCWKPTLVGQNLLELTAQHSGLDLDVAGDDDTSNGATVVQSAPSTSLDSQWHPEKQDVGGYLGISPLNTSLHLGHQDRQVVATSDDDAAEQWLVVPGLASADCISLESRDAPGRYLRHENFIAWSDHSDGSELFARDATFCLRAPLQGTELGSNSLESFNYPGRYLVLVGSQVFVRQLTQTPDFLMGATWQLAAR